MPVRFSNPSKYHDIADFKPISSSNGGYNK